MNNSNTDIGLKCITSKPFPTPVNKRLKTRLKIPIFVCVCTIIRTPSTDYFFGDQKNYSKFENRISIKINRKTSSSSGKNVHTFGRSEFFLYSFFQLATAGIRDTQRSIDSLITPGQKTIFVFSSRISNILRAGENMARS